MVRAQRMLDVRSGRIVAPASLVVTGDRITAVNPAAPPAGAAAVDLGDVTLMPGFIDMQVEGVNTFISESRVMAKTTQSAAETRPIL